MHKLLLKTTIVNIFYVNFYENFFLILDGSKFRNKCGKFKCFLQTVGVFLAQL
jgi:hypothetical protein